MLPDNLGVILESLNTVGLHLTENEEHINFITNDLYFSNLISLDAKHFFSSYIRYTASCSLQYFIQQKTLNG